LSQFQASNRSYKNLTAADKKNFLEIFYLYPATASFPEAVSTSRLIFKLLGVTKVSNKNSIYDKLFKVLSWKHWACLLLCCWRLSFQLLSHICSFSYPSVQKWSLYKTGESFENRGRKWEKNVVWVKCIMLLDHVNYTDPGLFHEHLDT